MTVLIAGGGIGGLTLALSLVSTGARSRIPEMKLLTEFAEQDDEGLAASLYLDRPHLKRTQAVG